MFRTMSSLTLALAVISGCAAESGSTPPSSSSPEMEKVVDAMRAAPPAVTQEATILDRPTAPGEPPKVLRAGSNGWTCTPSRPGGRSNPSCVDANARAWFAARSAKEVPRLEGVGLSYRLMGDDGASNVDPFATGPTPENEWVVTGPHLIIFVPNVADLVGRSSDHTSGGPYVMWRDTPYAHIMVPVAAGPGAASEAR